MIQRNTWCISLEIHGVFSGKPFPYLYNILTAPENKNLAIYSELVNKKVSFCLN
jgi:hypothetical protein